MPQPTDRALRQPGDADKRRRLLLVGGAAAAVVVVGLLVLFFLTRTVDTRGSVTDARSGQPLPGVAVKAGDRETVTTGRGAFVLRDVGRGDEMRFSLTNYESATRRATEERMRVRLAPIPVKGKTTSNYTKGGIEAAIGGKVQGRTSPDGSFELFGAGPGDTLTFTAFGHKPATVTVDDGRNVVLGLDLAAADLGAMFAPVDGYSYVNLPRSLEQAVLGEFRAAAPDFGSRVTGLSMKSIVRGGEPVAAGIALAVDPAYASTPDATAAFFRESAKDAEVLDKPLIDGAVQGQVTRESDGSFSFGWQRYSGFMFVVGDDRAMVEQVAKALISRQK